MANAIGGLKNLKDDFTRKLEELDTNKDGRVSREEVEAAAREHFGGKVISAMGMAFVAGVGAATVVFVLFKLFAR